MEFEDLIKLVPPAKQAAVRQYWDETPESERAQALQDIQAKYGTPQVSLPTPASDVTAVRPGLPAMGREAPTATIGADPRGPRVPVEALPRPGALRAGLNAAGNTLLPFADEIVGVLGSGHFSGPEYETKRRLAEYQIGRGAREHPVATAAGTVAGGALGAYALPLGSAEQLATRGALRRGLTSLAEGAGIGAVYGAGASDPGHRGEGAVQGGLVGGLVGTAAPVLSRAAEFTPLAGTGRGRSILDIAEAGDADIGESVARMGRADPQSPLAVADVVGPVGTSRIRAIRAVPGPGQRTIDEVFTQRLAGRPGRLVEATETAMGAPRENSVTAARTLQTAKLDRAEQMYDAALRPNGVPVKLDPAKTTPLLRIRQVRELLDEYRAINDLPELQMNAPGLNTVTGPELQYVKRRLAELGQGAAAGNAARTQAVGRAAGNPAEAVQRVLEDIPGFADADKAFARDSRLIEARDVGGNALQRDPEVVADFMRTASPEERAMAQRGFPSSVGKALDQNTARGALARLGLGELPRGGRQRLIEEFLPPEAEAGFLRSIDDEAAMLRNENAALSGSETSVNLGSLRDAALSGNLTGELRRRLIQEVVGAANPRQLAEEASALTAGARPGQRGLAQSILGEAEAAREGRGMLRRGFNLAGRAAAAVTPTLLRTGEMAQRSEDEERFAALLAQGLTEDEALARLR